MKQMIRARGLTKEFSVKGQIVEAVTGLDLDVGSGELVAFLGPNGAGKSTSLRMLTTLILPTAGDAWVAGHDVRSDPGSVRRRIGYIGQGTSGGHNQRVRDELISQGAFYGMSRAATRRRADELLRSLDLELLATRTIVTLSGGQKRRLDIALGLFHAPKLLFLDEPSTGLDPQNRANLWEHIVRLREEHGTTIFFSTHYLDEADQFAERVMVMDHGRLIADDTASVLKSRLAGDRISLTMQSPGEARRAADSAAAIVTGQITISETSLTIPVDRGDEVLPRLITQLHDGGLQVQAADLARPTLDDVFLALTGRSLRETAVGTPTQEEVAA